MPCRKSGRITRVLSFFLCMHLMNLGYSSACAFDGMLLILFKGLLGLKGGGYFVTFKETVPKGHGGCSFT